MEKYCNLTDKTWCFSLVILKLATKGENHFNKKIKAISALRTMKKTFNNYH